MKRKKASSALLIIIMLINIQFALKPKRKKNSILFIYKAFPCFIFLPDYKIKIKNLNASKFPFHEKKREKCSKITSGVFEILYIRQHSLTQFLPLRRFTLSNTDRNETDKKKLEKKNPDNFFDSFFPEAES